MKDNPWNKLKQNFNINDTFETEIVNIGFWNICIKFKMKLMEWFMYQI